MIRMITIRNKITSQCAVLGYVYLQYSTIIVSPNYGNSNKYLFISK